MALRVAVLGAGIAGSALATFLARRGAEVTLFDDGRRPELVVGESLVPAVVPILERLGIEKLTATFSRVKPGVTFVWSKTDRASFSFARFAPGVFPYAYNIPRPRFDGALLALAVDAGATKVVTKARVEAASDTATGAELALTPDTLAAAPSLGGRQPDLIVDATGRARHAARVLGIGADVGPRRDVAHFAHYEGFRWDDVPGQVLISRLAAGWSWCIPLVDRLSIGIVLGQDDAAELGRTPEERLSQAIATDSWLSGIAGDAKRVTSVATYSNYQLVSQRAVGPGWVMVGDAFGFVDPMLSPGVFLALHSAEMVVDALSPALQARTSPSPAALARALEPYTVRHAAALEAWTQLVAYLYDGRLLALMRAGRDWMERGSGPLKSAMQDHIERHIALQASGMGTMSRYSRGLLAFLGRYGLRGVDPSELVIR
jgi:flavin-dependent dehydrogenase